MQTVISVKNVKKHFKSNFRVKTIEALSGISFDVMEGDVFGFVGHNGAGKTTLIKTLMGLISASGGEATILGKPIGNTKTRSQIGFVPERPYFYEYLTARETLKFYGTLSGMNSKSITKRTDEMLELLGLVEAADRPTRSYSKGMLQRLGVAQALIHDPPLVILDEPMSGLDPIGRGQIKHIIRTLKKQGKTIFFSTHILSDVEQLCNRVAMIATGRLIYAGDVEQLTAKYEEGLEFVLGNLNQTQINWLQSQPGQLVVGENTSHYTRPKTDQTQEILTQFLEHGIIVTQMIPKRPSLEDIFLSSLREEVSK